MKFILGTYILISLSFSLNAQMLDNSKGNAFSDEPFFNQKFVRSNKIKKITGHYSTKASMDMIRENDLIYVYQFDSLGRMSHKYETVNIAGGRDTIVNSYDYDKSGNLAVHRRSDQHGFYSTHYTYDSLNRIVRTEYRRDMSNGRDKVSFHLDKSYIITYETSVYYNSPGQEKRVYFNNYDKPFQEKFSYTDENGYLKEEEEKLTVHSGRRKIHYNYNEKGLLQEVAKESSVMGKHTYKEEFKYDKFNNLLSKHIYRNEDYKTEIQIVYDPTTKLVSAVITRKVSNDFITILKFDEIEFYDAGTNQASVAN
jgi:hypothetical protein